VTSVKYCSGGSLSVIRVVERTRGEAGGLLPLGTTVGTTQCTSDKDCPSTYCQKDSSKKPPYICKDAGKGNCNSDADCSGSYCMMDSSKSPPYQCHGGAALAAAVDAATCFHNVDSEDHKCFEACAASTFATKGITDAGKCPSSFDTVDKTTTVYQCPDGVSNVRYCASTALNVTIATKGEAGVEVGGDMSEGAPAWITGDIEAPQGEKDMGGWTMRAYTKEQQERLNIDEEGTALPAKEEALAPEKMYCVHNEDAGDHKCYEACTGQGRFKMKGLTSAGQCPSTYNEVDSRKEDKVCNDGVTSVKYCSGGSLSVIRVVERTRGKK